jgi:alpha-methylacyl-CoA racemase
MTGPLAGVRVLEVESIGPGPFAAMMLADLGADVLTVGRPSAPAMPNPVLGRGRSGRLGLDLKSPIDRDRVLGLVERADVLIEGYRPGVMERLGLGPDNCLGRNGRLVYGRITGWGRSGPLAHTAGHDINYIALSGALHACGTRESGPVPPLNLVGDFGGGGLMLALGIVSALFEARSSGRGQVVDTAMVDGAAVLMGMMHGMRAIGRWPEQRAGNLLDGSAYFYTCYACADGQWMSVGCIEPQFRRLFFDRLGLGAETETLMQADDHDPLLRERIAALFRAQPRAHWERVFDNCDACVTPVLSMDEVVDHPHNQAWGSCRSIDGVTQPMPAPRFSRTPTAYPDGAPRADLSGWGIVPPSAS